MSSEERIDRHVGHDRNITAGQLTFVPDRRRIEIFGISRNAVLTLLGCAGTVSKPHLNHASGVAIWARADSTHEHGWFYHWINVRTGERTGATFDSAEIAIPEGKNLKRPKSEVSVSDSTWLVLGALTAWQYFHETPEIGKLATKIYERVDYRWMRNGHPTCWRMAGCRRTASSRPATRSIAS